MLERSLELDIYRYRIALYLWYLFHLEYAFEEFQADVTGFYYSKGTEYPRDS